MKNQMTPPRSASPFCVVIGREWRRPSRAAHGQHAELDVLDQSQSLLVSTVCAVMAGPPLSSGFATQRPASDASSAPTVKHLGWCHENLPLRRRLDRRNHRRPSRPRERRRGEPDRARRPSRRDPPERPAPDLAARGFHRQRECDRRSGPARPAGRRVHHPEDAPVSRRPRQGRAAAGPEDGADPADHRRALLVLPQAERPVRGQPAEAHGSRRQAMVDVRARARAGLRLLGGRRRARARRGASRERGLLPAARRARRFELAARHGAQRRR